MAMYIDNWLILASSRKGAADQKKLVTEDLSNLQYKPKKECSSLLLDHLLAHNRYLPFRLGGTVREESSEWEVRSSHALISHKLPGAVGDSSDAKTFPSFSEGTLCVGPDGQHHSGGLYTGRGTCWHTD